MMLMTKFGKFKLRLIATINLSVLLSLFNIASYTSNYWIKYIDHETGHTHYAGMFRSCPSNQGGMCSWKSGIIENNHSFWSSIVRLFVSFGTLSNLCVVVILILALFFKLNKKSKLCIRLLEYANFTLILSFILILVGFCVFISTKCNYSMWFHIFSMILIIITSNFTTRTFCSLYFQNTRLVHANKSVETALSTNKLSTHECKQETVCETTNTNIEGNNFENKVNQSIEMNKIPDSNEGNEPLIQTTDTQVQQSTNVTQEQIKLSS